MASLRTYKTKQEVKDRLKEITPASYGVPGRKLEKKYWKTTKGYTGSVKLKR